MSAYGWKIGVISRTEGPPDNPSRSWVTIDGVVYGMGSAHVSAAKMGAVFACFIAPSPPFAFGELKRAVFLDSTLHPL